MSEKHIGKVIQVIDPVAHGLDMLYSEGSADCAK